MSGSAIPSPGAAESGRLPATPEGRLAWVAAVSVVGALLGLASGDVRAFTFSVVCGAVLGLFFPAGVPFAYVLLVVAIPVHILTEEIAGIPYLGGGKWGFTKLHPATLVILVAALMYRLSNRNRWLAARRLTPVVTRACSGMFMFVAGVLVLSVAQIHPGGVIQVVENYLGPLLLFLLVLAEYHDRPQRIAVLTTFFILVITLVGIYGIIEYGLKDNLLYGPLFSTSPLADWYATTSQPDLYRITTSLGHPLTNAQYYLLAITLTAGMLDGAVGARRVFAGAALPVLVLATVATGGRATLIVLAVVPLFVLLLQRRLRALAWAIVFGVVVFVGAAYSPYGDVLRQRFTTAEGVKSALVRLEALKLIPETLASTNPLLGYKLGRSGEVSTELLASEVSIGFENPWLMLLADVGIPLTVLYVGIVVYLVQALLRGAWRSRAPAVIYPAIGVAVTVLMYSGYNSFGSKNTLNYLLWFISALAFSAAAVVRNPARPKPPT